MSKYICVSCETSYDEADLWLCHKCNEPMCPKCGGEIVTNEEYERAMKFFREGD